MKYMGLVVDKLGYKEGFFVCHHDHKPWQKRRVYIDEVTMADITEFKREKRKK